MDHETSAAPRPSASRAHGATSGTGGRYASFPASYRSWLAMRARCTNPRNVGWPNYGGRGIKVCARWRDDYPAFLADMGEPPPGHSLDRIDADGDYEPGNCRWADASAQARNTRLTSRVVLDGREMPAIEACALAGINYGSFKTMKAKYRMGAQALFDHMRAGRAKPRRDEQGRYLRGRWEWN